MTRKATETATSCVVLAALEIEIDFQPARRLRCSCTKLRREFGHQWPERNPAIFLHLREMIAVNDRERADAAADPAIGRARLGVSALRP